MRIWVRTDGGSIVLLALDRVAGGYGETPVLFDVTFEIAAGEAVALVGRNGMGKTTTMRTILGLCPPTGGTVTFDGKPLRALAPYRIARLGIGWVPEGRLIFPTLSVRENLTATAANHGRLDHPWTVAEIMRLFPRLHERAQASGDQLSGGEAQMLAIGRALMLGPRLILLDEATEGLAPVIRDEIWKCIGALRERGQAVIVVDKHLIALARVAERAIVIEKGRTVWTGSTAQLAADREVHDRYLGV
jgi:branched-chain amino acid transport system ATP-binding protein